MNHETKTQSHVGFIVTIDGPSASGKSTIAKLLAKRLNFLHLDTGAIYRSIALWCQQHNLSDAEATTIASRLQEIDYACEIDDGIKVHRLGGKIVNDAIRTPRISQLASKLALIQEVRDLATSIQRKIVNGFSVVVEGRDAGTVVFPNAPVKIYLIANRQERAKRRVLELKAKYPNSAEEYSLEATIQELQERDERDRNRILSPMKKAVDAVTIDTSGLSIEQVLKKLMKVVKLRKPRKGGAIWRYLIGEKRAQTTFLYKITYLTTYVIYRMLYRYRVYGLENYPCLEDKATIVAPNHSSFLDPPAVGIACPCELHALAIDYLFRIPLLGWILRRINVHPVSSNVTDAKVLRSVVSLLKEGRHVLIFPEGSRSRDDQLLKFKRGVAVLAALTNCSITPTYVDGAFLAWRRGKMFPKPWGKISVVFGKPLHWKDYESKYESRRQAEQALLEDLKSSILELKKKFRQSKS